MEQIIEHISKTAQKIARSIYIVPILAVLIWSALMLVYLARPYSPQPAHALEIVQLDSVPPQTVIADQATDINDGVEQVDSTNTPVLMYHHIKTNADPKNKIERGLDVPAEQFDLQMASLAAHGFGSINLNKLFFKYDSPKVLITFDDGYKDVITAAYPIMTKYNFTGTVFIISDFVGKDDYLNWDDIRALQNAGWEIGSHTLNHLDLTKISPELAKREISESKNIIESQISSPIGSFCYPSGKYNDDTANIVRNAGYSYAVTTKNGKLNKLSANLVIKRIRIDGQNTIKQFENKVY